MNFNKSIFENRNALGRPLIAAHRGVCGANIPCNSMAAYKIAADYGADVVEIDVAKTADGKFYAYHPGMEHVFLKSGKLIRDMNSDELESLRLYNQDGVVTSYKVPTLAEVLNFLKGKVYINVDKFWTDVEGIANEIRAAGVENQVIVKTGTDKRSLDNVKKYAPDFMFMPIVRGRDEITESLMADGVNVIAAEVLFSGDGEDVISDEYIERMHSKGLLVWTNAIIYNEKDVIAANHSDDISLSKSPELGWGWLIDKKVDFIQTDWLIPLRSYMERKLFK